MKVAAVQFQPKLREVEANLHRAAELTVEAARGGATLIVHPELCTTGYSFMNKGEAEPYAEELIHSGRPGAEPSRSMHVFGTLARKLGVTVVWGVMEKDPAGKLYNSQVLITPEGSWVFYRKINKWGNDYLWASSGESNPPIHVVDGKKVGLLICRDVRDKFDKDWTDFYEAGDADVVCLSANWGDGGFPAVAWMDFAKDNNVALVISNRYGREENNNFGEGGICVVYPDHRVACDGLKWSEDCIVYAEV